MKEHGLEMMNNKTQCERRSVFLFDDVYMKFTSFQGSRIYCFIIADNWKKKIIQYKLLH